MPISNAEIEVTVIEACKWLGTQEKPCYSKAARKFGVHRDRVRRRFLQKSGSLCDTGGLNKRLNADEDRTLCEYIDFADEIGLPIQEKTLVDAANSIIRKHRPDAPPVSKMWASRWLTRHPEHKEKFQKPPSVLQKSMHVAQKTPDPLIQEEEEEEEEEEENHQEPKTPTTTAELFQAREELWRDLIKAENKNAIPPRLSDRMKKYLLGSTIRLDFCDQIESDLRAITATEAARKARDDPSQCTVLGGGVVSVDQGRQRIEKRAELDEKAERSALNSS